jgi:hypothetical protein
MDSPASQAGSHTMTKTKPTKKAPARPSVRGSKSSSNGMSLKSAPVAKSALVKTKAPEVRNSKGAVIVTHREFVTDIIGSGTFSLSSLSINPGLPSIFNWLSSVALAYESYRFRKLSFHFTSSASTATSGTVIVAVDFNPQDLAPISKQSLLNLKASVRGATWESFEIRTSPTDLHKLLSYFTRSGLPSGGAYDIKTYDVGNL